jgi:hypothetical protein
VIVAFAAQSNVLTIWLVFLRSPRWIVSELKAVVVECGEVHLFGLETCAQILSGIFPMLLQLNQVRF